MKKNGCTLRMNGVSLEDSFQRFSESIENAISPEAISKYKSVLQANLHNYLKQNASRADVPIDVEDIFSVEILNNDITISNTNPYLTDKYEYGYSDGEDIITPRYYIRPAIDKFSDDLKNLVQEEINNEYERRQPSTVNKKWEY